MPLLPSAEGSSPLAFLPRIVGVERTQAIQYFPFNGEGAGTGGTNSVPLIQGKATLLRVYIDYFELEQVTGALCIDTNLPLEQQTVILPTNGWIEAQPSANLSRVQIFDTMNFVIPASASTGVARPVSISIGFGSEPPYDLAAPGRVIVNPGFEESDRWEDVLSFKQVEVLVYGVLVHYTGLDTTGQQQDFGTATLSDLEQTLAQVKRVWPVGDFVLTGNEVLEYTPPPASQGVLDVAAWKALNSQLDTIAEGTRRGEVVVGVVPGSLQTPTGVQRAKSDGTFGLGGIGRTASGFDNQSIVPMAQEIGHALGRQHAPCAVPAPNLDPHYPSYGSYPTGSIGEVGVDPLTLKTFDPSRVYDFMTYCLPVWVSPYSYQGLLDSIQGLYPQLH